MQIPVYTPEQATTFGAKFALHVLKFFGWKLRYNGLPANRGVIIFYPHTSNWDFFIGIMAKWAIEIPLKFLAKEKLFKGINRFGVGNVLRFWGGEPIERGTSNGAIAKLAERMQRADWFWLAIAPEGTRQYTPYIRSGFYHIALQAKVPLVCAFIDYPTKELGICKAVDLTGDEQTDLAQIQAAYAEFKGLYPENHSAIAFRH